MALNSVEGKLGFSTRGVSIFCDFHRIFCSIHLSLFMKTKPRKRKTPVTNNNSARLVQQPHSGRRRRRGPASPRRYKSATLLNEDDDGSSKAAPNSRFGARYHSKSLWRSPRRIHLQGRAPPCSSASVYTADIRRRSRSPWRVHMEEVGPRVVVGCREKRGGGKRK